MVVQSQYNIQVKLNSDDDKLLIFNSLSGAFIEINKEISDYFSLLKRKKIDLKLIVEDKLNYFTQLKQGCFLIDENINEIELLKYLYNKTRFSNNSINLTILPTLDCNLHCTYCYQEKNDNAYMNEFRFRT